MIRIAAIVLCLLAPTAGDDAVVVLSNARILPVSGDAIPNGVVVIAGGKIRLIAENYAAAEGETVIDLQGKTVIPGLIDAGCSLGVAGMANEDGDEVAPEMRIVDSLDPRSPDLTRARQSGVTAALIEPGNRGVIGGVGSVIKTSGDSRGSLIVRETAALKAALGAAPSQGNYPPRGAAATFFTRRPTTRMGVAWEFRKAFFDAKKNPEPAAGRDLLLQALDGKLQVRISAGRLTDLETAVQIADELGLSISIEEGQEAYKIADALAAKKIPVLLRPAMGMGPAPAADAQEIRLDAFTLLLKAGVKTALLPPSEVRADGLLSAVAFSVRHGAGRADALRAATLTPAEILGVADRMGSLEKGKDATLVVLSGEPHEITTRVERVMIDGRWVFGEGKAK